MDNMEEYTTMDYDLDFNLSFYGDIDDIDDLFSDLFELETNTESQATSFIVTYVYAVLIVIGVLGNLVSCVVMYDMGCHVLSTCRYLALLAVLDILLILTSTGNAWLTQILKTDPTVELKNNSDVFCRTYTFLRSFCNHLAQWLLVTTAVEGIWLAVEPKKCSAIFTKFRARTTILLLTLVSSLVNIHFFWTYMMMARKEGGEELTKCAFVTFGIAYNKTFQTAVWPILDLLFAHVLPIIIIGICTVLSLRRLLKSRKLDPVALEERKTYFIWGVHVIRQLHIIICVLGLFYIVLWLPHLAWKLKTEYTYKKLFPLDPGSMPAPSNDGEAEFDAAMDAENRNKLINAVMTMISQLFMSLKVFVYAAISSKFRQGLKDFVLCKKCWRRDTKLSPVRVKDDAKLLPSEASSQKQY